MNSEKLKLWIRNTVKESLKEELRPAIKELLGEMLLEHASMGNSSKARMLREASYTDASELDAYPTLDTAHVEPRAGIDRSRLAELMGYGEYTSPARGSEITVDHYISGEGNPIPINPNSIPQSVKDAFNRDYRELMAALDKKKHG